MNGRFGSGACFAGRRLKGAPCTAACFCLLHKRTASTFTPRAHSTASAILSRSSITGSTMKSISARRLHSKQRHARMIPRRKGMVSPSPPFFASIERSNAHAAALPKRAPAPLRKRKRNILSGRRNSAQSPAQAGAKAPLRAESDARDDEISQKIVDDDLTCSRNDISFPSQPRDKPFRP